VRYIADRVIVGDGRIFEPGYLVVDAGLVTNAGEGRELLLEASHLGPEHEGGVRHDLREAALHLSGHLAVLGRQRLHHLLHHAHGLGPLHQVQGWSGSTAEMSSATLIPPVTDTLIRSRSP